ncbi:MAG: flavin reductase family protein [Flavobacteriales bacterium]|nr:flavin reductase family protein [Flavobacteriales bacterium]
MLSIDSKQLETKDVHQYLLGAVGPRPIAFASTMDKYGNPNLSPFSFFNVFSANPPTLVFSPARRVRDNSTKDTLSNCDSTKEVVINVVNYAITEQMNLSSTEYPSTVNEFVKAGLTPVESKTVRPYRVKESPAQFECIVKEVIHLGDQGGAGNLIICEVKMMHFNEAILNDQQKIDQHKIDLVGRMGGNWYVRASGEAIFELEKPQRNLGIGVDMIPPRIRNSFILTGNDLGKLGNVERIPTDEEIEGIRKDAKVADILSQSDDAYELREMLHQHAHELLKDNKVQEAWSVLLIDKLNRN